MTIDELVERLRGYSVAFDEGANGYNAMHEAASQLLAMKGALERISHEAHSSHSCVTRSGLGDIADALLSPTKSAADKIAEGLRDAIAMSNASRGG
jgi:hypothetical protein